MQSALSRTALLFFAVIPTVPTASLTGEKNYCNDPEAETPWMPLLAKNPKDYNLQALHALRTELCIKADQGMFTTDEATEIFEDARHVLVSHWKSANRTMNTAGEKPDI